MQDVDLAALALAELAVNVVEQIFRRTEHQGQRRSELVTDVAEERRLGPIHLGQRLGTAPRLLERDGVADRRGDMVGGQLEEVAIPIVQRASRTHAGDQHAVRMIESGTRQRQQHRGVRGLVVRATRQRADALPQVRSDDGLAGANDV